MCIKLLGGFKSGVISWSSFALPCLVQQPAARRPLYRCIAHHREVWFSTRSGYVWCIAVLLANCHNWKRKRASAFQHSPAGLEFPLSVLCMETPPIVVLIEQRFGVFCRYYPLKVCERLILLDFSSSYNTTRTKRAKLKPYLPSRRLVRICFSHWLS